MRALTLLLATFLFPFCPALSENLYSPERYEGLFADNKAARAGDILTVLVYQNAEARNTARTNTSRRSDFSIGLRLTGDSEFAEADIGSGYDGVGGVQRSQSFITSISVSVIGVLENGDLMIEGSQQLFINGEANDVLIRGRVRTVDISPQNTILSTRIAEAIINYDGQGFVTRSIKPGLISRIFDFLGL